MEWVPRTHMESFMPNAIFRHDSKRDHKDAILEALNDEMLIKLSPTDTTIAYEDVVCQVWDADTIRQVKAMAAIIAPPTYTKEVKLSQYVDVKHAGLHRQFDYRVNFTITAPSHGVHFFPREWQHGAKGVQSDRTNAICDHVVEASIDRGLLRKVITWLADNCKTHEQAAWLLPSWATICRRNNALRYIGHRIADVQKPRTLPAVPPDMRIALRWAHQFLATHELMGTFDKERPRVDHANMCRIALGEAQMFETSMGDLKVWVSLI